MGGRRLLVTGGAGFIGAHFIRGWRLRSPDDQIINLDLLTYAGSRQRLADIEGASIYRFLPGDIRDAGLVREAMRGVDTVIHFAAETHVDRSIADATAFLRTNVEGVYVLLEQARACDVARFVHVSTDEVYGPILEGAVDESAPFAPRSPYAASKAAGELLIQAFRETHAFPSIVVRPTNIYGPAQLPEKFIALCITRACEGLPVPLYGDGQQRRAWLFVDDVCEAIRLVAERGIPGEAYNIASGHEQTNVEMARLILSQMGRSGADIEFVADRPGHDRRYAMRDEKVRALGWSRRTPLSQGLAQTIEWYQVHSDWWRPLAQRLHENAGHWLNRSARASAEPMPRPNQ